MKATIQYEHNAQSISARAGSAQNMAPKTWREIIGGHWPDGLENIATLGIARARFRDLMKTNHPDAGGNADVAAAINNAMAMAESELSQ